MRKFACALLVLLIGFGCVLFVGGSVRGETSKSGLLTSDETWTVADSPITLTGPVNVVAGVILTIEPGVTVNLGSYYLLIDGTLNAQGTPENTIIFTSSFTMTEYSTYNYQPLSFSASSASWSPQDQTGSAVENAVLNVASIAIEGCSPKIAGNTFNSPFFIGVNAKSGSHSLIINNVITCGMGSAINAYGDATVTGNTIYGSGWQYGITCGGNAHVSKNLITHCSTGIKSSDSAAVENNAVINSGINGVECASDAVKVLHNYIASNRQAGIAGGGIIQNNYIFNNSVGITSPSPQAVITNNNFVGNTQNSVVLTSADNIDTPNNWWGTTDNQAIDQSIHDNKDDYNLGVVNYEPALTEPNPDAPSSVELAKSVSSTVDPTPIQNDPTPSNDSTNPSLSGLDLTQIVGLAVAALAVACIVIVFIRVRNVKRNPEVPRLSED
jgi:hypothetical protein